MPYQHYWDRIHSFFCRSIHSNTTWHFSLLTCAACQSVRKVKIWTAIPGGGRVVGPTQHRAKGRKSATRPETKVFRCNYRCRLERREPPAALTPADARPAEDKHPPRRPLAPRIFAQMKFEPCYYYAIPHNLCKRGQVGHLKADSLRARLQRQEFLIKESAAFGSVGRLFTLFSEQELPRDKV